MKTPLKQQHPRSNQLCKFYITNENWFYGIYFSPTPCREAEIKGKYTNHYYLNKSNGLRSFDNILEWEYFTLEVKNLMEE